MISWIFKKIVLYITYMNLDLGRVCVSNSNLLNSLTKVNKNRPPIPPLPSSWPSSNGKQNYALDPTWVHSNFLDPLMYLFIVPETLYFSTWTVSEHWAHSEPTLSERWAHAEINLVNTYERWMVSKRRAQMWSKRWMHGECLCARETIYLECLWSYPYIVFHRKSGKNNK